jgi:glycerophosphoryl diester phosphodiesterase
MKSISLLLLLLLNTANYGSQTGSAGQGFRFIAHRGASYLAPENTLASIRLAWELGADGAECDVMLTSDKKVILFHDKTTKRLTGENLTIAYSSWDELRNLSIIPRESNLSTYKGERIPLLQEVLGALPENKLLVIEVKSGIEIIPHLQQVIDQFWNSGFIAFIAFDFETIRGIKECYPNLPCYYLSMLKSDLKKRLDDCVESNLDGVDLRHSMIDKSLMEQCKNLHLDVWCWTVNDPKTARKMKDLGVTAITTDRPKWLKENL